MEYELKTNALQIFDNHKLWSADYILLPAIRPKSLIHTAR